jgi:asparagine synthase (glutamine-hydrolysing)
MRGLKLPPADRYLAYSSYYSSAELAELMAPDLADTLDGYDPFATHRGYFEQQRGADELSRLLYVDAKTFLPCLNLTYTDKMGMAASVEVRVPLLDDELVELAARIPSNLKIKRLRRKYIFKRSQEGTLPHNVIWRRKAGFGAPIRAWLERDLAPVVDDLLSEETVQRRGLLDFGAVQRLRADNAAGLADNSLQIYTLLCLELWHRTFLDRPWSFDTIAAALQYATL